MKPTFALELYLHSLQINVNVDYFRLSQLLNGSYTLGLIEFHYAYGVWLRAIEMEISAALRATRPREGL